MKFRVNNKYYLRSFRGNMKEMGERKVSDVLRMFRKMEKKAIDRERMPCCEDRPSGSINCLHLELYTRYYFSSIE
ncbi:MAG: hypothetical protein D3909_00900 [Candidatus Electrothrix sp. ATG1]|nr:hypothetical protein [Candidatus Electrothrix sp. ATG1]